MSVAVLMISVIVRMNAIEVKYPGGLKEYAKSPYVWYDEYLVASSFMNWLDVEDAVSYLAEYGIAFDEQQQSPDIAIVDQARGIMTGYSWLLTDKDETGQRICWLGGTDRGKTIYPQELADF